MYKFIPDGFAEVIVEVISEAENYVNGKRAQTELDFEGDRE